MDWFLLWKYVFKEKFTFMYSGRTLKYPTVPNVLLLLLDFTFEMYKMSESLICDKALYEVKETSAIWSKRYQRMRQR